MKQLVFDSGTLISLVTNDLIWTLRPLKEKFKGDFLIPPAVRHELVDYPIETDRFKFEAIRLESFIEKNILTVSQRIDVTHLLHQVNHIYNAAGHGINILHYGETEALALAISLKADAYVVDERTMRWLIEDPEALRELLQEKLHTKVSIDYGLLTTFKNYTRGLKIFRSTELMMIAYELGILDSLVTNRFGPEELVDGLLRGLKAQGCAISEEEIKDLVKLETR